MQSTTRGQRRRGRPKVHWHDNIMKWTGLSGDNLFNSVEIRRRQNTMAKDCSWSGQPCDRGRLNNNSNMRLPAYKVKLLLTSKRTWIDVIWQLLWTARELLATVGIPCILWGRWKCGTWKCKTRSCRTWKSRTMLNAKFVQIAVDPELL